MVVEKTQPATINGNVANAKDCDPEVPCEERWIVYPLARRVIYCTHRFDTV
jgi:hypothetical protein